MSTSEPFNTLGGYSVGIPPQLVIDSNGNVVTNVNAPNANLTANRVFANSYLYANGQPLSIGASGSNTQVQYNNNGLLGASSSFTFNSATNLLTVTNLQVGNRANLGSVANVVILGGTNGYFLQTDGTGNLTWAPAGNGGNTGNGTPGGSNTQVQYNNAGNFAGNAGFTYNSTTNLLTVGNISTGNITANYIVANWDVTANVVDANYLYGDGSNITNVNAVTAGVANSVAGANVSGQVNFAAIANSVAGANVTGQVNFANVANNVAGANVSGQVANALVAGTVYTAAQPNITSVGNLTSLTVVGNTTLGNQVVANYFIGNLFGLANNARTVTFSSQPNITSVGTLTSLTVSGTTILGNSVSANYFVGTLYGVANTALTANVANVAALANVANFANTAELANNTLYSNTANIANVAYSVSGSNIVGPVASATVAATVSSNAQPNITSVGELSSLVVTGNTTVSNITGNFIGNGARLTNLAGGNVTGTVANATYAVTAGSANTATSANIATTAGTVTTAAQPNITSLGTLNNLEVAGNIISSNITGNFIGNGSRLTNIAGSNVTGTVANAAYALSAGSANTANNANTATTAGTVTTAAQPNITSVGTLSSLSVASNISTTGNVLANSGFVRAGYFIGPLATASQPNITSVGTLTSLTVNGVTNLGNVGNLVIQGGNANYVLSTDGAGNLNWIAQSNGGSSNATPAGSNTYLQYNDNGVFGASANLTYNDSTRNLFVNGNANANGTVTAKTFVSNIADGTAPLQVTSTTPVANLAAQTAATVRSNAQPNITSVGTLTSLAVSGNISGGNVQGGNLISANFVFGTLTTAAQPNITSVGTLTSLGVNGNITGTNITSNTGIFAGNAAGLTNIPGANVTGTVANATYAVTAGSANSATSATTATTAGTVTNNSQPNITSVGTLTNLNVAGNVLAGNLNANNVVLSSNGAFFGNGAGLSSLNASNLTTGTVPNNRLSGSYNINVTNANTANTVVDAIQPNITSVGTLTQLYVNGTANLGNVGNIKIGGGTNGYVLSTDGTGNLSWTAQTGGNGNGTPGGATTQIQYNGDGAFAGSPNLSWTNSTNFLYVGGNATITGRVNASVITSNVSTGTAPFIVVSTTPVANLGVQTAATVRTNAQPNITSVGTLTNLDVSGNIVTNNLTVNTTFTTNGNIVTPLNVFANNGTVRANLLTGILTTATQPNITSIGNLTTLVVTGNVSAGNLSGANSVSANFVTGTLTTNAQPNINYVGNLGWLNVNTSVPNSNGNITFNGSMSGTGAASNITITGNVHAGNFVEANYLVGVLTTNAQPNITSVGTLTGITVNGTANLGNVANVKITGGTNGYVLSTDGAGNLSWVAQSNGGGGNGVPGGSNTQIQFNDAGSFGGSGNFTFNKLTNQFTVAGNSLVTGNSTTSRLISTVATGTSPFVVNSTTPVANLAVETAATVRNGAQPNITSVGTLTGLTVAGNITSNNLTVDNSFSVSNNIIAGGNIFANNGTVRGNLLTGTLTTSLQPNITSVGTLSNLSVTGNATVGNLLGANLVSANFVTGTLTTNAQPNINYVGNLGYLNVDTAVANGNGNIVFNGTLRGTGAASDVTVTGNVNAGNWVQASLLMGTLTTSSQPNITTVGNLTTLTVLGNSNLGSVSNIRITGGNANYVLSTDGAGNLSWVEQSGGGNAQPAGPNTSLQFNDGGVLGGVANLNFNKTTSNLFLNGNANIVGLATAQTFRSTVATGSPPIQVNSTTPVANLAVETAATVRNSAQPNITSVGTLTSLDVSGNTQTNNITVTNLLTANTISSPGTIGTTNLNVTGNAALTGNVSLQNTTANKLTVTGNINANASPNVTLGNISNLHIFGGINGYYLQTDGAGNLTWAPGGGGGGNGVPGGSNTQVQFNDQGEFGGAAGFTFNKTTNTLSVNNFVAFNVTANNFAGNGANITNVAANTANVAFSVAGANVTGEVNFAAVANSVAGSNVSGQVNFAAVANSVAGANVTGEVAFANVANNVSGANVTGTVANAAFATLAATANTALTANAANTAVTVTASSQPNITSVGTLTSLDVIGNVIAGNLYANAGTVRSNLVFGNLLLGTLMTGAQPNITSVGTLTSLTVNGTTNTTLLVANTANVSNINANTTTTSNLAVTGNAIVTGNLTVNGNLVYVNVETLAVEDPIIELQVGPNGNPPIANSGKDVGTALNYFDTDARKAFMGWDVSGQEFIMASRSQINDEVVTVLSFGNLRIGNIIGNGQALTGLNGSNIVGTVANANYAAFAGDVVNAAQPNITSLGTLVNLAVSGNVVAGNVNAGNTLTANFVTGTLTTSAQPNVTSLGTLTGLTVNGISNLGSNANVKITGGAVGQVLGTDGTGNLSWITGAGSPGGANTAVQYNDAGTFGGSSFFTFNELTNNVNIAGNLIANSVSMGAGVYEFSRSYVYFATTNSTSEQVLLSIPATGMAAVDYTIISDDGSIRNFIKISAVRSGTTVNYVEYSTLPVNGYTGDFVVAYDAGNILNPASIQLRMTPQSANLMTHKMMVTTYKE